MRRYGRVDRSRATASGKGAGPPAGPPPPVSECARAPPPCSSATGLLGQRRTRGAAAALRRKSSPRPGALSSVDRAAEEAREPAAQRQAEARALDPRLQRAAHLGELLEDALVVLFRDADARVGHRERDGIAVIRERRADPDLAALGELEGVGDQVAQDLRDLAFVGVHARAAPARSRSAAARSRSPAAAAACRAAR